MKHRIKKAARLAPHIGMRKLKSILAVFVGFWLWQLVRLFVPELEVHPIFIYMYGVIEIRESSGKTVDNGKIRIKSTLIALIIGLPLLFLGDFFKSLTSLPWLRIGIELTVILVGSLLVLVAAELANCKSFCGVAATILIVLVVSHTEGEPMTYALLRSVQTVMGVFIAWLINVKLLPYPGKKTPQEE